MAQSTTPKLDLDEIQGDVLAGMQKNVELFEFFKIVDAARFKDLTREYLVGRLTTGRTVHERDRIVAERQRLGERAAEPWLGVNLGFTKDGLTSCSAAAAAARSGVRKRR